MASALHEFDVVIVGGGVVGASAAALLAKSFNKIALVDNSELASWEPAQPFALRVSAVNLGSRALLEEIGVWQNIMQMRAFPYKSMTVWEQASATSIQFEAKDAGYDQLGAIVENQVMLHALSERLTQLNNVTCFDQCSLADMSTIGEHAVLAELDDGSKLTAKLLIGADGQQSLVRSSVGIAFDRTEYNQVGVVCTVETEHSHQNTAWQCFTEEGPLALLPLTEGYCSVVWSVPTARGQTLLEMSEEDFNKEMTIAFEHRLGRLKVVSARRSFPLSGAQAERYIDERVVLVGDAAHVVHPLAGLGLNLGLEDVSQLNKVLLESTRSLGSQRVLRQYERARKSENNIMQKSLEAIDHLFRADRSELKAMRSIGVNLSDQFSPLKTLFMQRALGLSG